MLLAHHPQALAALRRPTLDDPLRVLVSGCLAGMACGVDGTDYGLSAPLREFLALPTLRAIAFCPEEIALGTPRSMPDIHGGDGFDVLDRRAVVLDEHGVDLTEAMRRGAFAMLERAVSARVELALLTDMSAACGSQVISDGCRLVAERRYRRGVGVATALLLRHGIPVVSQRDFRSLGLLREIVEPGFVAAAATRDHHETEWYRGYFGV
jgi:uncharacterized protein YbbK (DUF523 family)